MSPVKLANAPVPSVETRPFPGGKRALPDTNYTYQIALSASAQSMNITARRAAVPGIPASGDSRSGVLVFNGDKIVGSYILPGDIDGSPHLLAVHANYRNMGLATRMMEQWLREVPSPKLYRQPVNMAGVKTMLKAAHNTVDWAVANNKQVSQEVKDAWANGVEEKVILSRLY